MALVGNISGSSLYNSNIGISGSVVIANRPDATFPTLGSVGGDVVFFVSGSRGGKGLTAERTVSVFGGDAVVSGSLTIGTGSVKITSNDIQFVAFDTRIESGSGGLTFFDAGNTGGITLSSIAAASGDVVGPASSTTNAIAAYADNTGNLLKDTGVTIDGSNNVIIPGNLTVNGTTTTIDTTNLLVEDPLIYFGSGSVGVNRNGGIALASGSTFVDQALVWGRVTQDTWGAGRFDVQNGTVTDLTSMTLVPVRASKFEFGASTAYFSSSFGNDIIIDAGTNTSFKLASANSLQLRGYSGGDDPLLISTSTAKDLFISGTRVLIGHDVGTGYISIMGGDQERAQLSANSGDFTINARTGAGTSQPIILSGSEVRLAAQNGATGIKFYDASSLFASFTNNAGASARTIQSIGTNTSLILAAGTGGGAGDVVILSGSRARVQVGSTNAVAFERDNVPFLTFTSGSGATNNTTISTLNSTSVNLFNSTATTIGAFGAATSITMGAASPTSATTTIRGGTLAGDTATQNIFNTVATTANVVGNAATLNLANAVTAAQTINIATGVTTTGNTKAINIGTGGASGSTTNINLGSSTAGALGTITANENLVPGGDVALDLGSPSARWRNIYTGDLHLKNDRGDYTLIEEEDCLTIRFNKTGKRYKFVLEPAPEFDEN